MRCSWRTGSPLLSVPPGTLAIVAKATVAMSAATMVHESEVFISHSLSFCTSSLCVSMKISWAVLPPLFWCATKCFGRCSLMHYKYRSVSNLNQVYEWLIS
ncbi:hypothetical protein CsSME_00041886 [Camellia sinensis var. sinensis]